MVKFGYTSSNVDPAAGPTAKAISKSLSVSTIEMVICGIATTIYGVAELPRHSHEVTCLWLLHPRLQSQVCMAPFAARFIHAWNSQNQAGRKGLIAISFDQRNHGTREISPAANGDWRSGNPRHAQDMFGCYHGTSADASQLLDHIGTYLCPEFLDSRVISQNIIFGVSLGGHAAWQVILHDPRFTAAIIAIGCPDFTRLMYDRARSSKRKSWHDTQGHGFVGSTDFPPGLVSAVRRCDPAAILFSTDLDTAPNSQHSHFHYYSEDLTNTENEASRPSLSQKLSGKRILNLSGGADRLVPYSASRPFLDWLKNSIDQDHCRGRDSLYLTDIIMPDTKHEVSPVMVKHMEKFLFDTLEINGGSDSRTLCQSKSKI